LRAKTRTSSVRVGRVMRRMCRLFDNRIRVCVGQRTTRNRLPKAKPDTLLCKTLRRAEPATGYRLLASIPYGDFEGVKFISNFEITSNTKSDLHQSRFSCTAPHPAARRRTLRHAVARYGTLWHGAARAARRGMGFSEPFSLFKRSFFGYHSDARN
jgi:hypothetical protein